MVCFQTILDSCPVFTCLTPSSLDLARKGINQDLGSQHNTSRLQNPLQESLRSKPLLSRKIWSCSQSKTSWRNHEMRRYGRGNMIVSISGPRWAIDWLQCYNHPARGNKTAGQLLKSEVVSSIWIRSRRTRPELLNSVSRDANPHKVPKVPGELGGCLRPNRIFNISWYHIVAILSWLSCHTYLYIYFVLQCLQLPHLQWPWRCG